MSADPRPALLLVEDDEADIELARRAFDRAGYRPRLLTARDGEEALKVLRGAERVGLVVTDLKMPVMNGLELLRELRKDPGLAGLRVVVLTSSAEDRDRAAAQELGAAGFLQKPMMSEEWDGVIKTLAAALPGGAP